ncbi:MAG: integrase, partial [Campylobacter sp.]|nr:integrase [Campylobacter sp.]
MLKNIGYTPDQLMPHGFRGTFATLANESRAEHGFGNDIIQACLAHSTQNKVASAYNHSTYTKQRAELLEWWASKIFS